MKHRVFLAIIILSVALLLPVNASAEGELSGDKPDITVTVGTKTSIQFQDWAGDNWPDDFSDFKNDCEITYSGTEDKVEIDGTTVVGKNVGEVEVTAEVTSSDGLYSVTFTFTVEVTAKSVVPTVNVTAPEGGFVYNGGPHTPAVEVTADGMLLREGADYTVAYGNNTNAGTATVTVSPAGGGNYTWDTPATAEFTIDRADLTGAGNAGLSVDREDTSTKTVSPSDFGIGAPGSFDIGDDTSGVIDSVAGGEDIRVTLRSGLTAADAGPVTIPVTFRSDNYKDAALTLTVDVTAKKTPVITVSDGLTRTYGQEITESEVTALLTAKDGDTVLTGGIWTVVGNLPVNAGTHSCDVTFTPSAEDAGSYTAARGAVTIVINRARATVTAGSRTVTVGDALPVFDCTVDPADAALPNAPAVTCSADGTAAGTYPIIITGGGISADGNYDITYVNGTLTVVPAGIDKPAADPASGGDSSSAGSGGSGGDSSSAGSAGSVKVPVSGDRNSIRADVTVSGSTAAVTGIDIRQIENITGNDMRSGMIEIDFSGLEGPIDTAKIPSSTIGGIAGAAQSSRSDVQGLTIRLSGGEVSFDGAALAAIEAQAEKDVALSVVQAKAADLNTRQREAAGGAPVFNLTLRSGEKAITQFGNGHATVSLPYTLKTGEDPAHITVYYLDNSGNIYACETAYDVRTRSVIFTTGHLSLYFVGHSEAPDIWQNPFGDVPAGAWYYEAVRFVSANGLMNGYSANQFGPGNNLSRAQLAQILYNRENRPAQADVSGFTDAASDAWYANAVSWAAARGIVTGYGDGRFGPDDSISREQLAVMLWRYAGKPAASGGSLQQFHDAGNASGYALDALRWAVEKGIIGGYGDGRLVPQGLATRSQVAQMLKNYLNK